MFLLSLFLLKKKECKAFFPSFVTLQRDLTYICIVNCKTLPKNHKAGFLFCFKLKSKFIAVKLYIDEKNMFKNL